MKQPNLRLPLVVAALLLLPRLVLAQQTPEEAAGRYFQTMKSGDWAASAALMHPRAMEDMKALFVELAALDSSGAVIPQFFGVPSADLPAMPASQVYQRVLGTVMSMQPQVGEILRNSEIQAVGHVMEGDTAHVVYRMRSSYEGVSIIQTAVLSLAREGGEWKGLLTGDLQTMLAGLRSALQQESDNP